MPKFCGKCGSKIDETTGLCPECNKNSDLLNTFETDKSDSHINTDIDTAVTSKSEYVEEKATDISEKAVVSKFCKKCDSKIDVDTELCQKCNFSDNEKISVEIDYDEQKSIIENSNSNDSCYSDEKRSRFDNEKLEENELSDNGNSLKNKKK